MSFRNIDAYCPTCQKTHPVQVDVGEPQVKEVVHEVVKEDTAKVNDLTHQVTESQGTIDALQGDLRKWQSGENHLQAQDMLNMLTSCPNCKPTLEAFVQKQREEAVKNLTMDQVKAIAKDQKWWPPPPIDLTPGLSRKART